MSKAILVMDMPSSCDKCKFHYNTYDENDCYVDKCELLNDITIDGYIEKYDGCPLKEIPEKFDNIEQYSYKDMWDEDRVFGFENGWNECINAILG